MGREAMGVRGIRLREGDYVVGAARAQEGKCVLAITEKGYGKRTAVEEYRITGRGGWGAILMYGAHQKEISGGAPDTTNNRMELTAVISALSLLKEPCIVELWSDSKYVIDALEKGWARGWQKRGWVKSDKKPALNPDLWEKLLALADIHTLHYHWVKGHAENEYNNRCDELAVMESRKYK